MEVEGGELCTEEDVQFCRKTRRIFEMLRFRELAFPENELGSWLNVLDFLLRSKDAMWAGHAWHDGAPRSICMQQVDAHQRRGACNGGESGRKNGPRSFSYEIHLEIKVQGIEPCMGRMSRKCKGCSIYGGV